MIRGNNAPGFEALLHPIPLSIFLQDHWSRKPLHLPRKQVGGFEGLIEVADLERVLARPGGAVAATASTPRAGAGAPDPPPESLSVAASRVYEGASLRLRKLEEVLDPESPLLQLVWDMERVLQHPLESVSAYLARPGAAGLGPHHDETEIFTLQVEGRKRWRLWGRVDGRTSAVHQRDQLGPPEQELVLEAGDLLYMPKGQIHEVSAEAASFSITIVFAPVLWTSLLDFLQARLAGTPLFAEALPAALGCPQQSGGLEAGWDERIAALHEAIATLRPQDLRDHLQAASTPRLPLPTAAGLLRKALDAPEIGPDTLLEWTPERDSRLVLLEGRVRLLATGNFQLDMAAAAEPALRALLEHQEPFRVTDLHPSLSEAARLALARKLFGSGLLRPAARNRS